MLRLMDLLARVLFLVVRLTAVIIVVIVLLIFFDLDKPNKRVLSNKRTVDATKQSRCTILLSDRIGRLGNRLFMFATAVGLSLTHSGSLDISAEIINELNQTFSLDLARLPLRSAVNHSESKRQVYNHCSYLTNLFPLNTSQTLELIGFWQVHTYFANHSAEIRRQLTFKSSILYRVETFLKKNNTNVTRVGVHIRRGDFLPVRPVSSDGYVLAAMSYFTRKYSSVLFLIVTDDRRHCENVFGKRSDVFFTPVSFDAVMDLAAFTLCDHAIITVGTFGWWAAYLLYDRRGEVLTDAKFDRSPIDVQCQGNVFFPPSFSFLNKTV